MQKKKGSEVQRERERERERETEKKTEKHLKRNFFRRKKHIFGTC